MLLKGATAVVLFVVLRKSVGLSTRHLATWICWWRILTWSITTGVVMTGWWSPKVSGRGDWLHLKSSPNQFSQVCKFMDGTSMVTVLCNLCRRLDDSSASAVIWFLTQLLIPDTTLPTVWVTLFHSLPPPPHSPTHSPHQSVYHARIQVWKKHPLFADFGQKITPFSTEIADFEAQ